MGDALKVLEGAKALIQLGWNQNAPARNATGKGVSFEVDEACSWCLTGALARATWDIGMYPHSKSYLVALRALHGTLPFSVSEGVQDFDAADLAVFNDAIDRTVGEVIGVVDLAIERVGTEVA